LGVVQINVKFPAAAFTGLVPAGEVNDDLPHGGGSNRKKVISILPQGFLLVLQPQVSFVYDDRCIDHCIAFVIAQLVVCNAMQMIVYRGHKLFKGHTVAILIAANQLG
jgi:hypothetical protein